MKFKRNWDDSCPREWTQWEQDGTKYVIQDLPPEDDEEALHILLDYLATDEVLCKLSDVISDPESMSSMADIWRACIKERMTLACYAEKNGTRKLIALNTCMPKQKGDVEMKISGKNWQNVYNVIKYMEGKAKSLETLGLDLALTAFGLVVIREYRGAKLGSKLLAAREPMCRALGIKGTTTIFTSIASQKSAERAGFYSIQEMSIKELAEIGLDYPKDDERTVKIMIRKYD